MSAIDATFASSPVSERVISWEVLQTLSSDHLPIVTQIGDRPRRYDSTKPPACINWKRAHRLIKSLWHTYEPVERASNFLETIRKAIHSSARKQETKNKNTCPWWCNELEQLRRRKNSARNKKKHDEYKKLKYEQRRLFRKKRKKYFIQIAHEIGNSRNP